MNEIAFVLGVGIFLAFLLYIAFRLDNEHIHLKFLLIFFFLGLVLLIPKSVMDNSDYCEVKINQTIVSGSNTTYNYDRYCFPTTNSNGEIFFTQVMSMIAIITAYFLLYWFKKIFVRDKYF